MSTAQQAINYALKNEWGEAINTNLEILKNNPDDIDSLNRLARAYIETGEITKAKETALRVLNIDSINSIASKCLDKCKTLKDGVSIHKNNITTDTFMEIPGKTKIVELIHLGDENILAQLDAGDVVQILCHPHRISIVTTDNRYIGRLSDDISLRLRGFIKKGNKFEAIIKSASDKVVKVFIKGDINSFPTEKIDYVSFTPPELIHKSPPLVENLETVTEVPS